MDVLDLVEFTKFIRLPIPFEAIIKNVSRFISHGVEPYMKTCFVAAFIIFC